MMLIDLPEFDMIFSIAAIGIIIFYVGYYFFVNTSPPPQITKQDEENFMKQQQQQPQSPHIIFDVAEGTQPWLQSVEPANQTWSYGQPSNIPPFTAFDRPLVWNLPTASDAKQFLHPSVQVSGATKPILIAAQSNTLYAEDLAKMTETENASVGVIFGQPAAILLANCGFQNLSEGTYVVITISNDNKLVATTYTSGAASVVYALDFDAYLVSQLRSRKIGSVITTNSHK